MKNKNRIAKSDPAKPEKQQIGGRVPIALHLRLKLTADLTGYSKDQILEDCLVIGFGTPTPDVLKRNKTVREASKRLEGLSPFESPLIPINSNATLTSRGGSATLTIPFRRMGS